MSLVVPFNEIFAEKKGLLSNHPTWERVELKDVATILNGYAFKSTLFSKESGFPLIRIRDISKKSTETYYTGDYPIEYIIHKDDLLIGMDGNFSCYKWNGPDGLLNQRVCKIIANETYLNKKFLFYGINGYLNAIQKATSSVTVEHLSSLDILKIPFPLPPLNEQQRIVDKLDRIILKVQACQERLDKIPTILKRFRQAVLAVACSGRLTADWRERNPEVEPAGDFIKRIQKERLVKGKIFETYQIQGEDNLFELPEKWEWVTLGNYAECSRGRFSIRPRNDPSCYGGNIPFIQIGDLPKDGGYIYSHSQTLNEKGLSVSKMFPKNTVVIAIVGATIGNTGILNYNMCFPDSLIGIETGSEICNLYLELYLRNEKEKIRALSYAGGGQPNIKLETLNPYPIALPPFEEQKEIIKRVLELFNLADHIEESYQKAQNYVDKLTQSILAKAFRGELVPQDSKDEPASVLVERIRKERKGFWGAV